MDHHAPVKKPKDKTSPILESQPTLDKELTTNGSYGSVPSEPSVAAERLLVKGKGSLLKMESIVNKDDRLLINVPDKHPWRMICSLEIKGSSDSGGIGTGWFIGPKTLVTAGHCVYHSSLGGWAQEITIYPGRYDPDDKVFPCTNSKGQFHLTLPPGQFRFAAHTSKGGYGVTDFDPSSGNTEIVIRVEQK
ncbi:MAG: hypothetical protein KME55_22610 [Nostoc indistinguendum CM1-VF10]|jgi:V8-like Glu-specific endopeptidase|nr:hypothetical protein [Nostoc indistinguendum CM1-VF10]